MYINLIKPFATGIQKFFNPAPANLNTSTQAYHFCP